MRIVDDYQWLSLFWVDLKQSWQWLHAFTLQEQVQALGYCGLSLYVVNGEQQRATVWVAGVNTKR